MKKFFLLTALSFVLVSNSVVEASYSLQSAKEAAVSFATETKNLFLENKKIAGSVIAIAIVGAVIARSSSIKNFLNDASKKLQSSISSLIKTNNN